jgi:hypothetical protein
VIVASFGPSGRSGLAVAVLIALTAAVNTGIGGSWAAPRSATPAGTVSPNPADELDLSPESNATYRTFAAARERVASLVLETFGSCADGAEWVRGPVRFEYRNLLMLAHAPGRARPRWAIGAHDSLIPDSCLEVRFSTPSDSCPTEAHLAAVLRGEGWVEDLEYNHDLPEASWHVYYCREAFCSIEVGRGDSDDESDSTHVRGPGLSVHVECVPRPPEDPRLRLPGPR